MRIKVLLLGDNPLSVVADAQLLRDRGLLVYTAFNLMNIEELIDEIKPDVIFFDPHKPDAQITDTYNNVVNGIKYTHIPVIFTLSDDDVYLVTRKRTASKEKRSIIADNMVDAIKMSLRSNKAYAKKDKIVKGEEPNAINLGMVNARA
jgi:response regulator RpfG family c-di-GMP phosphodiesterase